MTKEETKQKLRKSGYNVIDDNSVVTVVIAPEVSMKNAVKDVKDKLSAWGYNASFAIRQQKGAAEIENVEDDEVADSLEDTAEIEFEEDEKNDAVDVAVSELAEVSEAEEIKPTSDKKNDTPKEEENLNEDEYFDEEDSDMLLTEESIQFSLEDFGLDF